MPAIAEAIRDQVVGSGTVTVVDAGQITHSSMWNAKAGQALSLLGLRVDVMGEGCRYDLRERRAYPPDAELGLGQIAAEDGTKDA